MSLAAMRARLAARRAELHARRIVVLAGGSSAEREVSLSSGRSVHAALVQAGFAATLAEVPAADPLALKTAAAPNALAAGSPAGLSLLRGSGDFPPDVPEPAGDERPLVISMLHGADGENGTWQGLLELLGLPHTSAGVKGSAVAMDKVLTKRLFESLGIPTPRWAVLAEGEGDSCAGSFAPGQDLVAKPVEEGSSVGLLFFANSGEGWEQARAQRNMFGTMLIEERIAGRELTLAVIGHPAEAIAMPLVEIRPRSGVYDYASKYSSGATEYVCPAEVEAATSEDIQDLGRQGYAELGLAPCARFDVMLTTGGDYYFLEANTLPGFTATSLLPKAAQAAGIEYVELLELLMLCGLERSEQRHSGRGD